jgi:hypothetical protein
VVENSFGLLKSVFRILHKTIDLKLENTKNCNGLCIFVQFFMQKFLITKIPIQE